MSSPPSVRLRPATDEDQEFLHQVYASSREEELAAVPWSPQQKDAFLRMQTRAQRQHYAAAYPAAHYQVLEVDGVPAGRMLLDVASERVHLVDFGLLPPFRNRGVGTALLRDLQELARQRGQSLSLATEVNNPARRLYTRLGFVVEEEKEMHVFLVWHPGS
jgi:ribosomal protein S18 acetylase RimI-like enzyme